VNETAKNPFDARRATSTGLAASEGNTSSFLPPGNSSSLESRSELPIGRTTNAANVEQSATEESTRQGLDASLPPYEFNDATAAQPASETAADEAAPIQENAPSFEGGVTKDRTKAPRGGRIGEFDAPQPFDPSSSGVRIVGDSTTVEDAGGNSATNVTELEKVQAVESDDGTKNAPSTRVAGADDIDSLDNPLFRKIQPKNLEPAPGDEKFAADDHEVAPARLSTTEAAPGDELYTVERNDNYWSIAQKRYGSGAYFKALYEYNRRQAGQANIISPGTQLRLPDEATLHRLYPTLCPPPQRLADRGQARTASANVEAGRGDYEVQDGDTLFRIARRELGNGSRFAEVYELNRDRIGQPTDRLQPGTRLRLPDER
jgi:nucleoid-associated protein YgaU